MPGMWHFEDVQIQLVDTPPVTAEHMPAGLLGTVRSSDIVALVVDASADPLEQAEMVMGLLACRGVGLRSLPHHELDVSDPGLHSGILIANKIDCARAEDIATLRELHAGRVEVQTVSALTGEGLNDLQRRLWQLLNVIRVYTRQPGKPPDLQKPFTLASGSTVQDLAATIHRELPERMKFARIWGDGRFSGQHVHRTEPLRDKDIVEVHE